MLVFFDSLLGFHNADVKAVCPWKGTSQTDVQVVWKNPGSSIERCCWTALFLKLLKPIDFQKQFDILPREIHFHLRYAH